ncbi:MAG: phenylacetic acid degradation operon negative regulatory protein [Acidimicrobiaceae bacterium]|nr:phenylacetic acid degradation operon negative regulatory protein [Acidimicrobiaceae bacterium]
MLPARVLVRAGELFGISEGTLRVALSRMVAAGELETADGSYRLAGRLLDRQARQEASRAATTRAWRGQAWRFAFVAGERRSAEQRGELRAAMRALRLAELREGVWLRPDNLRVDDGAEAAAVVAEQCVQAVGKLTGLGEGDVVGGVRDADMASRLWDVAGWARRAGGLRRSLARSLPGVKAGRVEELAAGFVLSADVLRHFQADPLLPDELLPEDWPGAALRAEYAAWDRAYRALLRGWWKHPDSP